MYYRCLNNSGAQLFVQNQQQQQRTIQWENDKNTSTQNKQNTTLDAKDRGRERMSVGERKRAMKREELKHTYKL